MPRRATLSGGNLVFTRRAGRSTDRSPESGQVLVLVILGIFVLFGAAALGIDGSRTFEERRAAQTAVDHAATAAAFASCIGGDLAAAQAAGQAAATRNGYNDAAASISVTINRIGAAANHTFLAAITSTIPSTFARVIGISTFTVSVEATAGAADCGPGESGPGALYGGGTCEPGKGVDLSGSNMTIVGAVTANADLKIGGSSMDFDEVKYVDDATVSGSTITYAPSPPTYPLDVGPSLPSPQWPAGWAPSDADAAMFAAYQAAAAANGRDFGSALPPPTIDKPGVWFTSNTSEWNISEITGALAVVLVSQNGEIALSNGNESISAWDGPGLPRSGVVVVSGKTHSSEADKCSKHAIKLSGQNWNWGGIMWAPGGLVEFSGSDSSTGSGSLIGWGIKLSGQHITIAQDETLFRGDPKVFILK